MSKKLSLVVDEKTFEQLTDEAAKKQVSPSEVARRALSVGLWMVDRLGEGRLLFQPEGSEEQREVEIVQP